MSASTPPPAPSAADSEAKAAEEKRAKQLEELLKGYKANLESNDIKGPNADKLVNNAKEALNTLQETVKADPSKHAEASKAAMEKIQSGIDGLSLDDKKKKDALTGAMGLVGDFVKLIKPAPEADAKEEKKEGKKADTTDTKDKKKSEKGPNFEEALIIALEQLLKLLFGVTSFAPKKIIQAGVAAYDHVKENKANAEAKKPQTVHAEGDIEKWKELQKKEGGYVLTVKDAKGVEAEVVFKAGKEKGQFEITFKPPTTEGIEKAFAEKVIELGIKTIDISGVKNERVQKLLDHIGKKNGINITGAPKVNTNPSDDKKPGPEDFKKAVSDTKSTTTPATPPTTRSPGSTI